LRPKGARVGVVFLRRGNQSVRQSAPPHQLEVWVSAVSFPSGAWGRAPLPSGFTTFGVLRKASAGTTVVLLLRKTGSHTNALGLLAKIAYLTLDPSHCLIQFSIVQDKMCAIFS